MRSKSGKQTGPSLWYVFHDDHVHVTNDTRAEVESWSKRGILFGEQAMSIFIILDSKLDENILGRSPGLHLRKVHRVVLVVCIDEVEFGPVSVIHLGKVEIFV